MSKPWFAESLTADGPHCLSMQIAEVLNSSKEQRSESPCSSDDDQIATPVNELEALDIPNAEVGLDKPLSAQPDVVSLLSEVSLAER